MTGSGVYRLGDFPRGRWWVRWIEAGSQRAKAEAGVELSVAISPLGNGFAGDVAPILSSREMRVVEMSAGLLPHLRIGSIVKDGLPDGGLDFAERDFMFELPRDDCGEHKVNDVLPVRVAGFSPDFVPPVVPRARYPVGRFVESFVHVLHSQADGITAIVPSSEMLRAFVAPHSEIALALMSGPWSEGLKRLVDPSASSTSGGIWTVALNPKIPDVTAKTIAVLMFDRNGSTAANSVHASLVARGRLPAVLPFPAGSFSLRARCAPIYRNTYLVVEIVGAVWPWRNMVEVVRDERAARVRLNDPLELRPADVLGESGGTDGVETISSAEAPRREDVTPTFEAPGVAWSNAPEVRLRKRPVPPLNGPQVAPRSEARAEARAISNPSWSGMTGEARASQTPSGSSCPRFEALADALDLLCENKDIAAWKVLRAVRRPGRLGLRDVWLMPLAVTKTRRIVRCDWANLSVDPPRPRAFLVCEISAFGRTVHWIEVETLKAESACSLLLVLRDSSWVPKSMESVMALARRSRGVWPRDPRAFDDGVLAFRAARHGPEGALSDQSVRRSIQRVVDAVDAR